MDPFSIALGVGSLANSVLQGNRAASMEAAIAQRNYEMQQRAYNDQQRLAREGLDAQLAATTDARGNVTRYIPGVGWVTTPSEQTRNLTSASDAEELNRLTIDAAMRRRGMQTNEDRRGREGGVADESLAELQQQSPYTESRLFNLLRARGREGLARGYDEQSRNALRSAMRTRSSNAPSIIAALAERRGEANRKNDYDAQLDAITQSEALTGGREARLGNKYNMFASRASNYDDTPFNPNQLGNELSAALANRRNTLPAAFGQAIGAKQGVPQLQAPKANYTNSMGLNALSDLLGAMKWGSDGGAKDMPATAENRPPRQLLPGGF